MVSIISRHIIKVSFSPKKEMQELSICILTGKGLLLWESCGGKRCLKQLTIKRPCQLIVNCPLFLSFAQSVVKDTDVAFAIVLQLIYDSFGCRFFFYLFANEPEEEVS